MDAINQFLRGDYMPHGHCYLWQPGILWTNVISDALIALAYFSIPIALLIFVNNRKDLAYRGLFQLFAAFILLCGLTHLFSIYVIWHGSYGLHGLLKAATAVASVATAIFTFRFLPLALKIPSPKQLESAIREKEEERTRREAESIFRRLTDLVPTGLMAVNENFDIVMANPAAAAIFEYEREEIIGKKVESIVGDDLQQHNALMGRFFKEPEGHQISMAGGRIVQGKTKSNGIVDIEVGLVVHKIQNENYAFIHITDIREQEKLRDEHKKLLHGSKRAIDAVQDGVWEWYVKENKGWWNHRLAKMIGLKPDTLFEYELWLSHIAPEFRTEVQSRVQSALEGKEDFFVEYRGKSVNGEYQWFRTRGSVEFIDGEAVYMVGTLSNIENEKIVEESLKEKTVFLDSMVSKSVSGIYIYDIEKQTNTFINPVYTQISGYTPADIENMSDFMQLFHPEDLPRIVQHIEAVISIPKTQMLAAEYIDYRFKHKGGHWIWLQSRDSVFEYSSEGAPQSLMGSFIDISILKKREEELAKLAKNFSNIFEKAAVGIAQVSIDGKFERANNTLCEIFGYNKIEISELNFRDLTHPEELEQSNALIKSLIEGKRESYAIEKRYYHKHGHIIWALLTVSLVKNTQGIPEHFIAIIENISERKNMEKKLAESNKALEHFAYTASHDLQEPLRKITAFSGMLSERLSGKLETPGARYELERISQSAKRMNSMIRSLLELSKYYTESLNYEPVECTLLIKQFELDYAALIEETGAEIELKKDFKLWVDPILFQQVINNLIHNAIKYRSLDRTPHIKIWPESHDNKQQLYFQDNGQGFLDAAATDIFLPFKRLVGREFEGMGMGLASCKRIIEKHSGSIRAIGNPGKGATFIIEIPLRHIND